MCGRYLAALPPQEIARWFGVTGPLPNLQPRWNAAPTQDLPVVRWNPETGARSLDLLRWGLVPHWAKDSKIGNRFINARAETLRTTAAFRSAFARRRCIVPSGGFYEWRKTGGAKVPHAILPAEGEIFGFAGLWEGWRHPESGEWIRSFTIVTGRPNELVAPIHDRMPAILAPEAYGRWLGEAPCTPDELAALLVPYPAERMRAWPVSPRVNNARNEGADLLTPAGAESA